MIQRTSRSSLVSQRSIKGLPAVGQGGNGDAPAVGQAFAQSLERIAAAVFRLFDA